MLTSKFINTFLIRLRTITFLFMHVMIYCLKSYDTSWFTLFSVQDKLRFDPESEIATTGLRVSLICPVSKLWEPLTCATAKFGQYFILTFAFFFLLPAGKDAAWSAMSSLNVRPPSVFWCSLLPADEWEETHMDLPCLWQACSFWAAYYRRVRRQKHVLTCPAAAAALSSS